MSVPLHCYISRDLAHVFLFCIMQCRVKNAKCKWSKSATKYQLDPRGDLLVYGFEFWMCLQRVSVMLLILTCLCLSLKLMLKMTCFIRWQCHKLTKCFHQNHLQFSAVLPPPDNWTWSHAVKVLSSIGCSCKHLFLARLLCMAKSPCSKFETCNELAVNLSLWNVTDDEKRMPCLRLVLISVSKIANVKECILWIDDKILQKK